MEFLENKSEFLFYSADDGKTSVQVILDDKRESVWATQKSIAEMFGVETQTINYHLKEIFKTTELIEGSVIRKIRITASDGKRYDTQFYNLDAIIAVGYRVNSYQATQFRIWATKILKEYMVKGFALDDDRLKQGKTLFGRDYFNELIERIREIRASERRFYQKITDLYAQASIDYDVNSPITQTFYATVQNKLHWAITHHTAAELIQLRASAKKPYMGLTSWKNEKIDGKILKTDVSIAKNYLTHEELSDLNRIVNMYLDYAELQAKRHKKMTMHDWVEKLDAFLKFNDYEILDNPGRVSHEVAKQIAEKEYKKFRIQQDKEFESDFDRVVDKMKETGELPKEENKNKTFSVKESLSDFDKHLKQAIENPNKSKE